SSDLFSLILFVADLFHPIDNFSFERFLNGNMRHRRSRSSAVPMFFVRRKPDHIARPDFLDRSAFALRPPEARRYDQRLTYRMRMPGGASTRFERDARAANTRRVGRLEQRINAHRTGTPIHRSFARRLSSLSLNFHG